MGLQFSLNPALAQTAEGREIWIRVQNVAALYARHQERETQICQPLQISEATFNRHTANPGGHSARSEVGQE